MQNAGIETSLIPPNLSLDKIELELFYKFVKHQNGEYIGLEKGSSNIIS